MRCPHCNGNILSNGNKYQDQCLQCGRYPNPAPVYKIRNTHDKPKKLPKPCKNCKRTKKIVAHKLCFGCYNSAIRKGKLGSPEYLAGLKRAKKRYANPDYKATRGSYIRPRKVKNV